MTIARSGGAVNAPSPRLLGGVAITPLNGMRVDRWGGTGWYVDVGETRTVTEGYFAANGRAALVGARTCGDFGEDGGPVEAFVAELN